MGIRQVALVVSSVALVALSSCGGGDATDPPVTGATTAPISVAVDTIASESVTTTSPGTTLAPVVTTAAPTTVAAPPALVALAPETDGERAALATAASDEGRQWAVSQVNGPGMAAGEPFLGGYVVFFSDGTTGYQVAVVNGAVVGFFGAGFDILQSGPDYQSATMPAQTPRQQEAVALGLAEIVKANPAAASAEIIAYMIYFPKVAESVDPAFSGNYPSVRVFANDANGPFAQGGAEIR